VLKNNTLKLNKHN